MRCPLLVLGPYQQSTKRRCFSDCVWRLRDRATSLLLVVQEEYGHVHEHIWGVLLYAWHFPDAVSALHFTLDRGGGRVPVSEAALSGGRYSVQHDWRILCQEADGRMECWIQ